MKCVFSGKTHDLHQYFQLPSRFMRFGRMNCYVVKSGCSVNKRNPISFEKNKEISHENQITDSVAFYINSITIHASELANE